MKAHGCTMSKFIYIYMPLNIVQGTPHVVITRYMNILGNHSQTISIDIEEGE